MTQDKYKELRDLESKATDGPWVVDPMKTESIATGEDYWHLMNFGVSDYEGWGFKEADANFISLARSQLPDILADLDKANAEIEHLRVVVENDIIMAQGAVDLLSQSPWSSKSRKWRTLESWLRRVASRPLPNPPTDKEPNSEDQSD